MHNNVASSAYYDNNHNAIIILSGCYDISSSVISQYNYLEQLLWHYLLCDVIMQLLQWISIAISLWWHSYKKGATFLAG